MTSHPSRWLLRLCFSACPGLASDRGPAEKLNTTDTSVSAFAAHPNAAAPAIIAAEVRAALWSVR